MEYSKKTLADIKSLRIERHWSQAYLAEICGISIRTIQRIEKGGEADYETKKALSAVFEIEFETKGTGVIPLKNKKSWPWLAMAFSVTFMVLILGVLFSHFHWKGANMMLLAGAVVLVFVIVPGFSFKYIKFSKQ